MNKIFLLENQLTKFEKDDIECHLSSNKFPWFYYQRSTLDLKYNKLFFRESDFFCHVSSFNGEIRSNEYKSFIEPHFKKVWDLIPEMFGKTSYKVIRSKVNLFKKTYNILDPRILPWHTDFDYDHVVCLYYVNETTGKTIFKNGQSYSPKRGNFLIFDGRLEHTHRLPISNNRIIVNSNLVLS